MVTDVPNRSQISSQAYEDRSGYKSSDGTEIVEPLADAETQNVQDH